MLSFEPKFWLLLLSTLTATHAIDQDHDQKNTVRLLPPAVAPAPTGLLKPFSTKPNSNLHHLVDNTAELNEGLEFKCVQVPGEQGWRPQSLRKRGHKQPFPPLGRLPIADKETCHRIIRSSKNGVVCSNTGVAPFFKPTHFSGSTEYRKDFGFWGSSTTLEACLIATRYSSPKQICYWGGEDWYIGDIRGSKKSLGGPFKTVKDCVRSYGADPTLKEKREISSYFNSKNK